MKKIILFLITICSLLLLTSCDSKSEIDLHYVEDRKNQASENYTYRFFGESEHFYFKTGKVYYNENYQELLISNFKVKNNVDKNAMFSINLYFNDVLLYGDILGSNNLSTKNELESTIIGEDGFVSEKKQNGNYIGESDSFFETPKENFKDSIKLEGQYCIKDNCSQEIFEIQYLEEK